MDRSGRRRRWLAVAAVLASILPLGATADAGATGGVAPAVATALAQAEDDTPAAATPWTVLVYFAADTNIETSALIDLQELAESAGPGLRIVAFMDRSADYQPIGDPSIDFFFDDAQVLDLDDFDDSKVFEVTSEGTEVVWEEGELNSAHPQTLAWFLWYGLTNYPSDKVAAVLWDHGGGALYTFGDDVVIDGESVSQEYFSIPELQQAFQSALAAAGRDSFDLLVFDTCLDAAFEVARGMAPFADNLLASEEIMAGHGQDYTSFAALNEDPSMDGQAFGQAILDSFEQHVEDNPLFASPTDYTVSLVDLEKIGAIDTALAGFVAAMNADLATNGPALLQARGASLEFGYPGPDASINPNMIDLGDLLGRLPDTLDPALLNARNAVYEAVRGSVVASVSGPDAAAATGMSIYLPPTGAAFDAEQYGEIADPSGWGAMLEELLATGGGGPEVSDEGLDLQTNSDGWLASLQVEDTTALAAAGGLFGTPRDDGSMRLLAALPATIGAGDVDQIQAAWSYEFLELDGQPVTMAVEQGAEGLRASVPGVYFSASGEQREAVLRFPLQVDGGAIADIGDPTLLDAAGGSAAIPVSPDSQFVPMLQILDGAEFVDAVQLDPIDPTSFEVAVGEIATGDRFTAAVYVVNPDGSVTARSTIDNRP